MVIFNSYVKLPEGIDHDWLSHGFPTIFVIRIWGDTDVEDPKSHPRLQDRSDFFTETLGGNPWENHRKLEVLMGKLWEIHGKPMGFFSP